MKRINIDSRYINRDFRIKLNGNGTSTLIGFSRMCSLFKDTYVLLHFLERAEFSDKDTVRTKMRNGYTITLYRK